jgi:hypothetical protein
MATLDDVVTSVAAEDTAIDSAITLINGLQTQVAALKSPQTDVDTATKIDALNADIVAKTNALAAALVVNTPAAP